VALEEILGECLGPFQLRCTFARAEAAQTALLEIIDNALYQGGLRAYYGQAYCIVQGKIGKPGKVHDIKFDIFNTSFHRGTGIARSDEHGFHIARLRGLPCQSMFAPAAANN